MKLHKLIIHGFKSFADKTVIEFSPGITAIVGPNGCGKSNIADAFRWVLGEQSAKSMRGGKMTDVIFSGTSKRAPVQFSEVTIVLTEVTDKLPIEDGELSITRKLHRNGESDYLINNHAVRLKDVQAIFLDSGIGKSSFSIFEQGKIDQVIQYTPLERRPLIEEPAGMLRFLQRKREALSKLEQADANTSRVKDIHDEVEKQIVQLAQQAEKARAYKEQKSKYEWTEKALFVAKWENLEKKIHELARRENEYKVQQHAVEEQLVKSNHELVEAKQLLSHADKALRNKSESLFQARSTKEIKTKEKVSQLDRLKEHSVKEKRWNEELKTLQKRLESYQKDSMTLEQQISHLKMAAEESSRHLQLQRDRTHQIDEAVQTLRVQQQSCQQERLQLLQMETQSESELKQNNIRQDALQEKKESLQLRKDKLLVQIKELSVQQNERKLELQNLSTSIDEQKEICIQQEKTLNEYNKLLQGNRQTQEKLQQSLSETKARHKVLKRLRDDNEGFSAGGKRLLQESANKNSPLFGLIHRLYEFFTPHKEAEPALASVMRPYSQTLVVENQQIMKTVMQFAENHQLKDFSLFCLPINLPEREIKIKSLMSMMEPHALSSYFMEQVAVVNDLETAMSLIDSEKGISAWAGNEWFVDSKGVVFCSSQSENNLFLRETVINNLEKKLKQQEHEQSELEKEAKTIFRKRDDLQAERAAYEKNMRRDEMKLVEVNYGLQRCNADLDKAIKEEKQLQTEFSTLDTLLIDIAAKLIELAQKHVSAKHKGEEFVKQHTHLNSEVSKQAAILKEETVALHAKDTAYRKIVEEQNKLQHDFNILELKNLEGQKQEKRIVEELEGSSQTQQRIKQQGSEVDTSLQEVEKSLFEITVSCSELEKDVLDKKGRIETIEVKVQGSRDRSKQVNDEIHRVNIQKAQMHSALQAMTHELQERYQLSLEEARAALVAPGSVLEYTVDVLERQLRGLRQSIEQAGNINMTSIDEFEKHKTRYEFLEHQLGDLTGSRAELLEIIAELDNESRKIFKSTFEAVRANFQKNFQVLFNGGEADLQLTNAADILEAGIEIIAKPPGKQMRSISLMSGGEKCLTAMALLFAIFEVKSAPFCILDEIDAPLDDSNVERFVNMVKQFIEKCQFIIITHNKRTMAIADVLCGVSMEERGVSKLLALEFSKQYEPAMAGDV